MRREARRAARMNNDAIVSDLERVNLGADTPTTSTFTALTPAMTRKSSITNSCASPAVSGKLDQSTSEVSSENTLVETRDAQDKRKEKETPKGF